jgi:hypothetical protein
MTVELARDQSPSPGLASGVQAWKDDYPWLHNALREIGPGAQGASDGWRARIEGELKTTLDFKVRPDGTAAVWCGMSGYDFHHNPTPKELFEGLADAYRRERERKRVSGGNPWRMSADVPLSSPERSRPHSFRALPAPVADSLAKAFGSVLLLQGGQVMLIFLFVTALTLVLSSVGIVVR